MVLVNADVVARALRRARSFHISAQGEPGRCNLFMLPVMASGSGVAVVVSDGAGHPACMPYWVPSDGGPVETMQARPAGANLLVWSWNTTPCALSLDYAHARDDLAPDDYMQPPTLAACERKPGVSSVAE